MQCRWEYNSLRSFLFTIPSLNDSKYLTLQHGKISTRTFRLYNVQQIDQYGGLQTVSKYPAQLLLQFRLSGLL